MCFVVHAIPSFGIPSSHQLSRAAEGKGEEKKRGRKKEKEM